MAWVRDLGGAWGWGLGVGPEGAPTAIRGCRPSLQSGVVDGASTSSCRGCSETFRDTWKGAPTSGAACRGATSKHPGPFDYFPNPGLPTEPRHRAAEVIRGLSGTLKGLLQGRRKRRDGRIRQGSGRKRRMLVPITVKAWPSRSSCSSRSLPIRVQLPGSATGSLSRMIP